jgi:Pyridine nucleotide-disulphide oxidoreductase
VRGAEVDFAAVMTRVRRIIDEGVAYYEWLLHERGVDLVRLPARFHSANELDGADTVPTVDSDDLMRATEPPGHLVCVGAGAVSLEFAQAYRRLGAEVTIVQRGEHLAHGEHAELGDLLAGYLEVEGIRVLSGSPVEQLEPVDGRPAASSPSSSRSSSRSPRCRPVRREPRVAPTCPRRGCCREPQAVEVDNDGGRVDRCHERAAGSFATASTSIRIGPGSPAWTVVLAGYGSWNAWR